jgi:hypothetical protein
LVIYVGGIDAFLYPLIFFQDDLFIIVYKLPRIIIMGDRLTVVSKELIKSLFKRVTSGSRISEAPFPERCGNINILAKHLVIFSYPLKNDSWV